MKKVLLALLVVITTAVGAVAIAQSNKTGDKKAEDKTESALRARFAERVGAQPDSIARTPFGLYEVVVGGDIFYVDAKVDYLVMGRVFDTRNREDLTQKRKDEILKVDFKSLPLEQAVKTVRGDGSRSLVVFADPNCGYCKALEKTLANMKNVTVYTFLYPILSKDSMEKSKAVWCAKDRSKVWTELMLNGKSPAAVECDTAALQANLELGQKLSVSGTPTVITPNGQRAPGAVPAEHLEAMLAGK
ncbi:MAG: DsbC family protein [Burkholderiaceae bacterium]